MKQTIKKQIIAIGGGGFSKYGKYHPKDVLIEQYFLNQTGKSRPKICFIPTASGESLQYITHFYQTFSKLNCEPTHLSLFKPHTADLQSFILEQDAIYVGGGNTKSMLALWKEWKLDEYLHQAWEQGVVLGGTSAGSLCWFEQGVTDSIPGALTVLNCLGFIKGSNCPHYDDEPERKPSYHALMKESKILPGIAIDENAAVHFVNDTIERIVKRNPESHAYKVCKHEHEIKEEKL